jgi:hypothetical protein
MANKTTAKKVWVSSNKLYLFYYKQAYNCSITQQILEIDWGHSGIFPARESLVSDIPAGDGKVGNLFYSVLHTEKTVERQK